MKEKPFTYVLLVLVIAIILGLMWFSLRAYRADTRAYPETEIILDNGSEMLIRRTEPFSFLFCAGGKY